LDSRACPARLPRVSRPGAHPRALPDVRDGLTRLERIILVELDRASREMGRRDVPTALLYGRVVEHINVGVDEFQRTLARLTGR
jgi:hypothetical protein